MSKQDQIKVVRAAERAWSFTDPPVLTMVEIGCTTLSGLVKSIAFGFRLSNEVALLRDDVATSPILDRKYLKDFNPSHKPSLCWRHCSTTLTVEERLEDVQNE